VRGWAGAELGTSRTLSATAATRPSSRMMRVKTEIVPLALCPMHCLQAHTKPRRAKEEAACFWGKPKCLGQNRGAPNTGPITAAHTPGHSKKPKIKGGAKEEGNTERQGVGRAEGVTHGDKKRARQLFSPQKPGGFVSTEKRRNQAVWGFVGALGVGRLRCAAPELIRNSAGNREICGKYRSAAPLA
jgi:hypothetical protein